MNAENRAMETENLVSQTLAVIFHRSDREVWREDSGLCGFSVLLNCRDLDEFKNSAGPIKIWAREFVLCQGYEVISRHCKMWPEHRAIFDRAKKHFEAGDIQGGKRYIISYRNFVRDKEEFRSIYNQVRDLMRPALNGTVLVEENREGMFSGAAKVELDARIVNGTKPVVIPVTGFSIRGPIGSRKAAVESVIVNALGMISTDMPAKFFGYPSFGEVLSAIRNDLEKNRVIA